MFVTRQNTAVSLKTEVRHRRNAAVSLKTQGASRRHEAGITKNATRIASECSGSAENIGALPV
jgi:hypothetical protein